MKTKPSTLGMIVVALAVGLSGCSGSDARFLDRNERSTSAETSYYNQRTRNYERFDVERRPLEYNDVHK
jgi:hypothetical protein